jgi:hypothetical protein
MKTLFNISIFIFGIILFSCNTDETLQPIAEPQLKPIVKESISGFVQKGPFAIGTSITVIELDSTLSQTGRNFKTQITNNNGNFKLSNIVLNNKIVEIQADGFYFNEVRGITSDNRLALYSLSDLTDKNTINVNVLSTLEKPRIEYLVESGKSFSEAKKQAQKEVLAIFEVEKDNIVNSEELNISKKGDGNAVLLASSVILQGKRNIAELSELLSKISLDIREDGFLNDSVSGSNLINHAKHLNLKEIRSNIESKYFTIGEKTDTIPDFESIVNNFVEKTAFNYTLKIEYPRGGKYGISLLGLQDMEIIASPAIYSLKAIMPEGFKVRTRVIRLSPMGNGANWFYTTFPPGEISTYEMTFNQHNPEGIGIMEFTTKKNVTDADHILFFEGKGNGKVEIYENDSERPTRTTNFSWDVPKNLGIIYRPTAKYGENLFMKNDSSILESGKTYSLALTTPADLNLKLELWIIRQSGSGTMSFDKNLVINWSPNLSEGRNAFNATIETPGTHVDMPIVFSGTGECTFELRQREGGSSSIMFKHFKW